MTEYWLDYSAARLSGQTIKNAGYSGAIRYVGGTAMKHATVAECQSIKAAGLGFLAVMEVNTGDANGGYAQGVTYAQRAKAHCDQLGYSGVVFFCNDTPSLPSATLWDDYLTGAASVLGWDRVGAYGFANAMDVARNMTPCRYFWLAGSVKGVASRPYLNFWQDNNVQVTVGGITCDRNLVLKPITSTIPERKKMAVLVKGNMSPNVFKVEFDNAYGAIAVRTPVPNPGDPGYLIYGAAYGDVVTVDQAVIDAVPMKKDLGGELGYVVGKVQAVEDKLVDLAGKVDAIRLNGVDVNALASALQALLPTAEQVADVIAKRMAE